MIETMSTFKLSEGPLSQLSSLFLSINGLGLRVLPLDLEEDDGLGGGDLPHHWAEPESDAVTACHRVAWKMFSLSRNMSGKYKQNLARVSHPLIATH